MARSTKASAKGSRGRKEPTTSTTRKSGGGISIDLGGNPGTHPGSRDENYRGTVHWRLGPAGKAYLVRPPGGQRMPLEFCKTLPVSGEFDIVTEGAAVVAREP